jgi:hypothetical protein
MSAITDFPRLVLYIHCAYSESEMDERAAHSMRQAPARARARA